MEEREGYRTGRDASMDGCGTRVNAFSSHVTVMEGKAACHDSNIIQNPGEEDIHINILPVPITVIHSLACYKLHIHCEIIPLRAQVRFLSGFPSTRTQKPYTLNYAKR